MECSMCWEIYSEERVARNLLCGHSYCQLCLELIHSQKNRIECPMCRLKHDPHIKPSQLSKNFVAMDLAYKQQEVRKKLLMCQSHLKVPLQFFCEDCSLHICTECIIEHSGHKFCKQEHSVSLLKERVADIQTKLKAHIEILEKQSVDYSSVKSKLSNEHKQQVALVDKEFDKVAQKLEDRRKDLKESYRLIFDQELNKIDQEIGVTQSMLENMSQINLKLTERLQNLSTINVMKDNTLIKEIDNLQDEVDADYKKQNILKSSEFKQMPKITFNSSILSEISRFGQVCYNLMNPKICFFGDKHKILIYDIEKEEWFYKLLPQNSSEFNYYSACCNLPSGEIIITGGGVNRQAILVNPAKNFQTTQLKNMNVPRKEHAAVYLDGNVFVIGGYDGLSKQMLQSCERYNLETGEWKMVEQLNRQKCAFAATTVNNQFIYIFGGFDGKERLNTIEKYSLKENKWVLLDLKFKNAFSNASAVSHQENQILILGGGTNQGFSLELLQFDMTNQVIKVISKMSEGRDLRNKLAYLNGYIYACGGISCSAERYNIQKNTWNPMKNYNHFISDNLDSWCSSITFDLPDGKNKSILQHIQKSSQQYQQYEYLSDELSEELDQEVNNDIEDEDELEENFYMAQGGGGIQNNANRHRVFQI